jgi:DNA-binding FadR family transcriptional regulator
MAVSKVDKTLESLVDLVVKVGPGGMLPDQLDLAVQLGVSRTVLREALSRLTLLNVITMRPRAGTKVNPAGRWKTRNPEVIAWQERAGVAYP